MYVYSTSEDQVCCELKIYCIVLFLFSVMGCQSLVASSELRSEQDILEATIPDNTPSTIQVSPMEPGPKFPRHVGVAEGGIEVAPSIERATYEQCPSICDGECQLVVAETTLIVAGSARGHEEESARAIEHARRLVSKSCGEASAIVLNQPTIAELRSTIEQLSSHLVGLVAIGHGASDGIVLHDPQAGSPYLVAEDRGNLLTPGKLKEYLLGASLPYLQLFSCNSGRIASAWQQASQSEEIVFFDGSVAIDMISDSYIDEFVSQIPCVRQKWSCEQ